MKITFIKPTIGTKKHSLYIDEGRMEPLMLAVLAGLTPDDIEVVLYDDRMENIPYDEKTDLVAITIETYTAKRAYEISANFRKRGVRVIMGGMHTALLPNEVIEHCDSILIGDAETIWEQVVNDAKNNNLKQIYNAPTGIAQLNSTLPRRDLFKGKKYLPISLMQFSRGCRFACNFCAISKYFDKKHHTRRIDEVLREIDDQNRKFLFFVDDNIASNPSALKDLCRELIPMKVNWISQASLSITKDLEAMKLMADSGCIGNVMGFESITPASLQNANKAFNMNSMQNYKNEVQILRDFSMQTWAAFTLGYDSDTKESIRKTMEFALKNKFTFAAFNILMPYPNTDFYNKLKNENRLLYGGKWWTNPTYRFNYTAFKPKNMTAEELTDICHEIRTEFNSIPSIFYRFSDVKTNLKSLWRAKNFLKYAFLFKKEVHKKHRLRFGRKK